MWSFMLWRVFCFNRELSCGHVTSCAGLARSMSLMTVRYWLISNIVAKERLQESSADINFKSILHHSDPGYV